MIKDGIIKDGVVYEKVDGDCHSCDFAYDAKYEMCGMCHHWDNNTCFKRVDGSMGETANNEERGELLEIEKKLKGKSVGHFYYFYGDYKMCTYHINTLTLDEESPNFAIVNGDKENGTIPLRVLRVLAEGKDHEYNSNDGKFVVKYNLVK